MAKKEAFEKEDTMQKETDLEGVEEFDDELFDGLDSMSD